MQTCKHATMHNACMHTCMHTCIHACIYIYIYIYYVSKDGTFRDLNYPTWMVTYLYMLCFLMNQLSFWHLMGFRNIVLHSCVIVLRFVWILTVVLFIVTGIDAACTWWDRVSWPPQKVTSRWANKRSKTNWEKNPDVQLPNLMRWKSSTKPHFKL